MSQDPSRWLCVAPKDQRLRGAGAICNTLNHIRMTVCPVCKADRPKLTRAQSEVATRMVFEPIENGGRFKTMDGRAYQRDTTGEIRRTVPKERGKAARKADKLARRRAFDLIRGGKESVSAVSEVSGESPVSRKPDIRRGVPSMGGSR